MSDGQAKEPSAPMSARLMIKKWLRGESGSFDFSELIALEESWLEERSAQARSRTRQSPKPRQLEGSEAELDAARKAVRERSRARDQAEGRSIADDNPEPWVSATRRDRFGLALSGGGIRSATFNLGLLQALSREVEATTRPGKPRSVLDLVDYLATVSGGGYIGGFWSRWLCGLAERGLLDNPEQPLFPQARERAERLAEAEAGSIRHLRERSRFLIPRIGLFESQTWTAVVTVLGAMIPSLVIAGATLAIGWLVWLGLLLLLSASALWACIAFGVTTLFISLQAEVAWARRIENRDERSAAYYWTLPVVAGMGSALFYALLSVSGAGKRWGEDGAQRFSDFIVAQGLTQLLLPAGAWFALAALLLFVIRPAGSRFFSTTGIRVLERMAARCLAPAAIWVLLAGVWWLARKFNGTTPALSAAAGTAGATGVFIWLRDWLNKPIQETHGTQLLDKVMAIVKPLAPQLLAYLVFLGMLWLAARGVLKALPDTQSIRILTGVSLAIVAGALVLLDPKRIGLHEFYRSRIAATFLGGYRFEARTLELKTAEAGARGIPSPGDIVKEDVSLGSLANQSAARRPLHLVCTTANHLSGDAMPNLYRGGSSVTLSPIAVALGNNAVADPEILLSSALTASAAAFNSQMGSFSKRLGPAVAFIMSALGLRLGLWTKHPAAPRGGVSFPGRYFFEEMLGRSDTSSAGVDLHLSDGGHFENLALYELVRRHCRYILVSDCGADADVAFDDLANATRRIREDFGVEIELDVEPLRPDGSGLSQQHAVVGTIHYDGTRGSDKGVILYFKPCLVGDEPTDVMQYRKRNAAFPHEGTGDQFYDEAQWESYRRLGEHSARAVFRYLEDTGLSRHGNAVERLFLAAIERWQRLRGVEPERILQLAHERDELTSEIQSKAPRFFRTELFAELVEPKTDAKEQLTDAELLDTMHVCIRIVAFMDRVYHLARLETSWSHGSNQVWMTFFGRVCGAPTFRNWWPLLRPWCSNALRDFVRIRFGVRIAEFARRDANNSNAVTSMKLLPPQASMGAKNSYALDRWRARHGEPQDESQVLQYVASFQGLPHGSPARHLVVGVLFYRELQATEGSRKCFAWTSPELFVPDALTGAGFSSRLLDAVIAHFGGEAAGHGAELRVSIQDDPTLGSEPQMVHRDPAHRQARRDTQHFYKSRGFEQSSDPEDRATLVLVLPQGVSGSA